MKESRDENSETIYLAPVYLNLETVYLALLCMLNQDKAKHRTKSIRVQDLAKIDKLRSTQIDNMEKSQPHGRSVKINANTEWLDLL